MNYIAQLKQQVSERDARIASLESSMEAFRLHLHSAKFTGTENGERKDWIATGDVLKWLLETRTEALTA